MAKKKYDIVQVIWVDAEEYGETGWNDKKEMLAYAKKPCPDMRSVGYLVYRDDEHLSLLSTIGVKECSTPAFFNANLREQREMFIVPID